MRAIDLGAMSRMLQLVLHAHVDLRLRLAAFVDALFHLVEHRALGRHLVVHVPRDVAELIQEVVDLCIQPHTRAGTNAHARRSIVGAWPTR